VVLKCGGLCMVPVVAVDGENVDCERANMGAFARAGTNKATVNTLSSR
jgi:hypothetical protein